MHYLTQATSKDAAECIYFSRKCNVEPTHSMCASWIKVECVLLL